MCLLLVCARRFEVIRFSLLLFCCFFFFFIILLLFTLFIIVFYPPRVNERPTRLLFPAAHIIRTYVYIIIIISYTYTQTAPPGLEGRYGEGRWIKPILKEVKHVLGGGGFN